MTKPKSTQRRKSLASKGHRARRAGASPQPTTPSIKVRHLFADCRIIDALAPGNVFYHPISDIQFDRPTSRERQRGMLHRVSLVIDGVLLVDGLELNRQKQGGLRLHFPARPSNRARGCACIAPYNDGVRDAIENAVLHALAERDRTR